MGKNPNPLNELFFKTNNKGIEMTLFVICFSNIMHPLMGNISLLRFLIAILLFMSCLISCFSIHVHPGILNKCWFSLNTVSGVSVVISHSADYFASVFIMFVSLQVTKIIDSTNTFIVLDKTFRCTCCWEYMTILCTKANMRTLSPFVWL